MERFRSPLSAVPRAGQRGIARLIWLAAAGVLAIALAHDGWAREPSAALRTCPEFGENFWLIPGTATCLRIQGEATLDARAHDPKADAIFFDGDPFVIVDRPTTVPRVSFEPAASISFDTRIRTEFGTLRTTVELDTDDEDAEEEREVAGTGAEFRRAFTLGVNEAYVELGGIVAGLTDSFFIFDHPVDYLGTHVAEFDDEQILLGYTASLAKGFSARVALESGESPDRGEALSDYIFFRRARDERGLTDERLQTPNGVASLRLEQSWGSAQVSGAVGRTKTRLFSGDGRVDSFKDVPGWAAQAGLALNLPQLGEEDAVVLSGTFSRGLSLYPIQLGSIVWTDVDRLSTVETANVFAGFRHGWTPTLESNFGLSYVAVDLDLPNGRDRAKALTATGNLVWSPVSDLDVGLELIYARIDARRDAADLLDVSERKRGVFGAMLRIVRGI